MADNNKTPFSLIVDYPDTEQRYEFSTFEAARSAWRLCDYEIRTYKDAAHMVSARVVDQTGKQVLYCEQEA